MKSFMNLKSFANCQTMLELVNAAARLDDLRVPPANRLEKLRGNLDGYYSIRINDQWRVIFQWSDERAHNVRIIDYH